MDIAPKKPKKRSVVVGTLRERKERDGWKKSKTAHLETGPESPPTGLSNHVTYHYYKKFTGETEIDATPFKKFKVTAKELLSVESMKKRAGKLKELQKKKAEAAEREIKELKESLRLSEAPERGGREEDSTTNLYKKDTRNPRRSANAQASREVKEKERKETQMQGNRKRLRESAIERAKERRASSGLPTDAATCETVPNSGINFLMRSEKSGGLN